MPFNNQDYITGLKLVDPKIITAIYQNFLPKIEQLVIKHGGTTNDAEDIFQEVLIDIVQRNSAEKIETSFSAYLIRACKNQWFKKLRKKTEFLLTLNESQEHESEENVEEVLEQTELRALIKEKMSLLSIQCQVILKLSAMDGVTFTEIAHLLDIQSDNTARQRAFSCRNQLRKLLLEDLRFKDYLDY